MALLKISIPRWSWTDIVIGWVQRHFKGRADANLKQQRWKCIWLPYLRDDNCVHRFLPCDVLFHWAVLHESTCLTRSLGSRTETDLPPEAPLPSSWAKLSPELAHSNCTAKPCRFNRRWQNTHPSLSLLLGQCSSPLSLLHLPGEALKKWLAVTGLYWQ